MEALATGDEDRRPGNVTNTRDFVGDGGEQMLGVVEQKERSFSVEALREALRELTSGSLLDLERVGQRGDEKVRVAERSERHPPDAVGI